MSVSFEKSVKNRLVAIKNFEEEVDPFIPDMRWEIVKKVFKLDGVLNKNLPINSKVVIIRPQADEDKIVVNTGILESITDTKMAKIKIRQFQKTTITISLDYVYDLYSVRTLYVIYSEWETRLKHVAQDPHHQRGE